LLAALPLSRTSESKGRSQLFDTSAALDLTFLRGTGRKVGRNVKSTALLAGKPGLFDF
jgi:hypothetical protein